MTTAYSPHSLPAGPWLSLLGHAFTLIDEVAEHDRADPFWTFVGGTVLMLRYGHRLSKDIDIFIPDPQYLGFVNPRISDVASDITTEYEEHAQFVKLLLPERRDRLRCFSESDRPRIRSMDPARSPGESGDGC